MIEYTISLICDECGRRSRIAVPDPGSRTDGCRKDAIELLRCKADGAGWHNPTGTTIDRCPACKRAHQESKP